MGTVVLLDGQDGNYWLGQHSHLKPLASSSAASQHAPTPLLPTPEHTQLTKLTRTHLLRFLLVLTLLLNVVRGQTGLAPSH